jgi:hypothetical protein
MTKCVDSEDAFKILKVLVGTLGEQDVGIELTKVQLVAIARRCECIARWARHAAKEQPEKSDFSR